MFIRRPLGGDNFKRNLPLLDTEKWLRCLLAQRRYWCGVQSLIDITHDDLILTRERCVKSRDKNDVINWNFYLL